MPVLAILTKERRQELSSRSTQIEWLDRAWRPSDNCVPDRSVPRCTAGDMSGTLGLPGTARNRCARHVRARSKGRDGTPYRASHRADGNDTPNTNSPTPDHSTAEPPGTPSPQPPTTSPHGLDGAHAFHVVIPSPPGFGFSAPPRDAEMSVRRVAQMWVELMARLGYDRYGTHGGDLGSYIAPEIAVVAPERVIGVHIDGGIGFPTEDDVPTMNAEELAEWEMMQQWMTGGVDHHAVLRAAPQTYAHAWNDSPVGLLAWMAQKFQDFNPGEGVFTDILDRDQVLTNISLYWFTNTAGTSSWPMYHGLSDKGGFDWPTGQKQVPTGVYGGGSALMLRLAEQHNTIVHWPKGNPGQHHFIAMDVPDAHAADIRTFFTNN